MRNLRILLALVLVLTLCACGNTQQESDKEQNAQGVQILLSDEGVQVDGAPVSAEGAVYAAQDIVYYEDGKDFTYGEGTAADAHTAQEAEAHTVIHISRPGTYSLSGKLSKGQIAVDLGEDAKEDPNAVVTLILNGVDITCEVAPAVIFYNVYECGDTDNATKDVDTSAAGANVIIADGSENTVNGAYVARIYKPDSVILNEQGTEVEDAKKLHKYDAAFYSKMSMNVSGGKEGTGVLNIHAENEGLDSELHLTLNGGNIHIFSGNDGINTNEDGISVTTVNGGKLNILVTGETGEGDGIDSNGWLVINGGSVTAAACSNSADAGIDSDMGTHINGGTVIATGSMLDRIEDGGQIYTVFTFAQRQSGGQTVSLKDQDGEAVFEHCPQNGYSTLIFSSPELQAGTYTLWSDGQQLAGSGGGGMGMRPGGMMLPGGQQGGRPEGGRPEGTQHPEEFTMPEDFTMPEGWEIPEDGMHQQRPERPDDGQWKPEEGVDEWKPEEGRGQWTPQEEGEQKTEFAITSGGNMFRVSPMA